MPTTPTQTISKEQRMRKPSGHSKYAKKLRDRELEARRNVGKNLKATSLGHHW